MTGQGKNGCLKTLRKRAEFLAVANTGKKWITPNMALQVGGAGAEIRFGLTASRKVGNAVIRNRARRRLRALAWEVFASHAKPADYVLIARYKTAECDFDVLRQDIITALKKMKSWKD